MIGLPTETMEDVLRMAAKVDRPDVGVAFNLCHFLNISPEFADQVIFDAGHEVG